MPASGGCHAGIRRLSCRHSCARNLTELGPQAVQEDWKPSPGVWEGCFHESVRGRFSHHLGGDGYKGFFRCAGYREPQGHDELPWRAGSVFGGGSGLRKG